jgi:hypothetical protein
MFFKIFGSPEPFLQKGFWWGAGATPLQTRIPINPNLKTQNHKEPPPCLGTAAEMVGV